MDIHNDYYAKYQPFVFQWGNGRVIETHTGYNDYRFANIRRELG
jgi:hypothetical protein